jgi:hypothetical protein
VLDLFLRPNAVAAMNLPDEVKRHRAEVIFKSCNRRGVLTESCAWQIRDHGALESSYPAIFVDNRDKREHLHITNLRTAAPALVHLFTRNEKLLSISDSPDVLYRA